MGTGGHIGTGGTVGTGGHIGTGGTVGTGGTIGTGGAVGTGGMIGTGGAPATACENPTVNPLTMRSDFTVMVEENATLSNNENEGTIALGGDLTLGTGVTSAYNLNFKGTAATFVAPGDARATALLVGGSAMLSAPPSLAGSLLNIEQSGLIKIGNAAGVAVTNANSSTQIVQAGQPATSTPRIQLQNPAFVQDATSVFNPSWMTLLNFTNLFATYRTRSADLANPATCAANAHMLNASTGAPLDLSGTVTMNVNATITLVPGVTNVLDIGNPDNLNRIANINFLTPPTASTPLLINVHTPGGSFTFTRLPFTTLNDTDAPFLLWNFPEATQLIQPDTCQADIRGTIFAPNASFTDDCAANNVGNIVVKSFAHGAPGVGFGTGQGGEVHNFPFAGNISCPCH